MTKLPKGLPKARLFLFVFSRYKTTHFFAYFRNANAAFVWAGPITIGWRMPWLERPARQIHPELFMQEDHDGR